jgi:release factor glutamine methyltransferase
MKLLDLLESTTRYFQKHEVESPRLTVELILAHVLKLKRIQLYLQFDRILTPAELDQLRPLVKARAEGQPLQYVLGVAEFCGHPFRVTPDVLIPRPETEMLLELVRPVLAEGPHTVVEVGTGSGAIAVTLAREFPQHRILAFDVSDAALAMAKENSGSLGNISFQKSDLLEALTEPAHCIVANLPYIPTPVLAELPREVQREPRLALDGGEDGLFLMKKLIEQSVGRTQWLALEFGDGQADALKTLFNANSYVITQCSPDLSGKERIMIGNYRG